MPLSWSWVGQEAPLGAQENGVTLAGQWLLLQLWVSEAGLWWGQEVLVADTPGPALSLPHGPYALALRD